MNTEVLTEVAVKDAQPVVEQVDETPPELLVAAVSEKTAAWGSEWADGFATVNAPVEQLQRMLDAFGREDCRRVLQVHVSWARRSPSRVSAKRGWQSRSTGF